MSRYTAAAALTAALVHAAAVPGTPELLKRAGASVGTFWNQLSAVNCVETVSQARLGERNKILYGRESAFDYLIVLQLSGDDLTVSESRVPAKGAAVEPKDNLPLLLTSGFSMLELIFHPLFQHSFEYSAPQPVTVDGRELLAVHYRHVRGTRSPSVLRLRGREYPLDWEGDAWLDARTFSVVRVAAGLGGSLEDLGLKKLAADVTYSRIEFKEDSTVQYLPETATIEVETTRQRWRNVHRFSNYRRFSVDTKTELGAPN